MWNRTLWDYIRPLSVFFATVRRGGFNPLWLSLFRKLKKSRNNNLNIAFFDVGSAEADWTLGESTHLASVFIRQPTCVASVVDWQLEVVIIELASIHSGKQGASSWTTRWKKSWLISIARALLLQALSSTYYAARDHVIANQFMIPQSYNNDGCQSTLTMAANLC